MKEVAEGEVIPARPEENAEVVGPEENAEDPEEENIEGYPDIEQFFEKNKLQDEENEKENKNQDNEMPTSRVVFEKGWLDETVSHPHWILPSLEDNFRGDVLTVIVSLPGGMMNGDIVECRIDDKKKKSIDLVLKVPRFLQDAQKLSCAQVDPRGQRYFHSSHPWTLAHELAVRVAKSATNDGVLVQKMKIKLPFEVEARFYSDDDVPGQDVILTPDGEVILILRVMKRRPELEIPDLASLWIREVGVTGSPPLEAL